ncbi:MAG: hypothetical protein ACTSPG_04105 [Candidatus Hodarchaeales archaeon]
MNQSRCYFDHPGKIKKDNNPTEMCESDSFQIDHTESIYLTHTNSGPKPECPECGNLVETGEGCALCRVCGYSKCG